MFLIDLELVNLKNVVLVNSEDLRRKTINAKKKKLMEEKEYQKKLQQLQAQLEIAEEQKKSLDLMVLKKGWRITNRCCNIIP